MQYKLLHQQAVETIDRLERQLRDSNRERLELDKRVSSLDFYIGKVEGRENDLVKENSWLKTTLRLAILDADKVARLAKEIEMNGSSLTYGL